MRRRRLLQGLMLGAAGGFIPLSSPGLAKALKGEPPGSRDGVLNAYQKQLCEILSELIIPRTDTPGAIDAGVPHFIQMMVDQWYLPIEQDIFLKGLESLERESRARFACAFVEASEVEQAELLSWQEVVASKYQAPSGGGEVLFASEEDENAPFFHKLRELVVIGYYQSELGATQELIFDPMPHEYREYRFADVGRQWTF